MYDFKNLHLGTTVSPPGGPLCRWASAATQWKHQSLGTNVSTPWLRSRVKGRETPQVGDSLRPQLPLMAICTGAHLRFRTCGVFSWNPLLHFLNSIAISRLLLILHVSDSPPVNPPCDHAVAYQRTFWAPVSGPRIENQADKEEESPRVLL